MTFDRSNPLVSIVIPFYNCPFVDQAVASALGQTYSPIEVLVVDDGSTMHQEKLAPYFGRIHYLGKQNGGTASALNHGIRMSSGEYIAWLSSDDRFYPDKIARQVAYMKRHNALISCTDFDLIGVRNEVLMRSLAVKFPSVRDLVSALFTFCPINGCTIMMHRSVPERLGFFDEQLACTQDYEYWLRVFLANIDFHFINETLTAYRWHENMGTRTRKGEVDREFAMVRDRYSPHLNALLQTL